MSSVTPSIQNPADSVEKWPLARLIPNPRNPRTHNDAQVAQIAASMREWGWTIPVLVDEEGNVIAGHGRILAARKLGLDEAPVMIARGWSDAKKKAYMIADNKLALNSGWDEELLAVEMKDLDAADFNLELTGFNQHDIDAFLGMGEQGDEAAPAPPATPVARPGDLWLLGPHRILCGDCTDAANVARLLAGREPILLCTDPPYGIELDSSWRNIAGVNGTGPRTEGHTETTISGDARADWTEAFELVPSLAVAYVWHASLFTTEVLAGLLRIGFLYPQQIIWNKGRTVLMRTHYWYQHEPCWYVRKVNAPWFGKPGENSTIWDAPSPKFYANKGDEDKIDHPTQKPISLMQRSLHNHLKRGELVYDPFLGSGTTLAAAESTERICCGMELDPKYVDVIIKRWESMSNAKATLDGDGRTLDELAAERNVEVAA
jgi:DNA modification methylase